jgi:type IV secretory pathway VirB10-like protein
MRQVLALLIVTALVRPLWAAGPDEPRSTDDPGAPAAAPAAPAPTPAPAPAPTVVEPAAPAPAPVVVAAPTGKREIEEVEPNPPKKLAFIFLGAAGGTFLLGAILGGVAFSRAGEQTGDPANPPLYTPDLQSHAGEGRALAIAAYTFFALGSALAIIDAVLWFEALRKPRVIKRTVATSRFFPLGVRF